MTEKQSRKSSIANSFQSLKSTLGGKHTIKEDKGSQRKPSQLRWEPEDVPSLQFTQPPRAFTSNYTCSRIPTPSKHPEGDVYSHGIYRKEGRRSVLSSLNQRYLNKRKSARDFHPLPTPDHVDRPCAGRESGYTLEVPAPSSRPVILAGQPLRALPTSATVPCLSTATSHLSQRYPPAVGDISWSSEQKLEPAREDEQCAGRGWRMKQQSLVKAARPESSIRKARMTGLMPHPHPHHRIPEDRHSPIPSKMFNTEARPQETMTPPRRIKWTNRYENLRNIGLNDAKEVELGGKIASSLLPLTGIASCFRRPAPAGLVLKVTESQSRQYWLGRFVTLTNAFHYEDSFHQPDIATGFWMLSSYCRPLGRSDADLSNYRIKRAFMVLENVCTTEEASASLRVFREEYIRFHGDCWMR